MTFKKEIMLAAGCFSIAAMFLFIILLLSTSKAHANTVSIYESNPKSVLATSSPTYMTPGNATTTYSFDAYSVGGPNGWKTMAFNLQFTASSTLSIVNVEIQHSQDGIDWHSDGTFPMLGATSSPTYTVNTVNKYQVTYASSTIGASPTNSATMLRSLDIPVKERWVRVVVTMPIGSLNGAVWGDLIGTKENAYQ